MSFTLPNRSAAMPLIVGSWPGSSFRPNEFVKIFCEGLVLAGCDVVDVKDPRRVKARLDILHIHWPEELFWRGGSAAHLFYRTVSTLIALRRLRRQGVRLVWMVHNLRPHELTSVSALLWRLIEHELTKNVDAWMTLSPATLNQVQDAFPRLKSKPRAAALHPIYPVHAAVADRAHSRADFGFSDSEIVFGFLGFIRPYKGVESLIRIFLASTNVNWRLLIVGHPENSEYGKYISGLAAVDSRVVLRLGQQDARALANATIAVDAVVLPMQRYLHSGSMMHAVSHLRPVITPSAPFADELARSLGPGWITCYAGKLNLKTLEEWASPSAPPNMTGMKALDIGTVAKNLYMRLTMAKKRES